MFLMNETAITNDRMSVWSKILHGCVVFVLCFVHDRNLHLIMYIVKVKEANFSYLLYVFPFRFF